MGAVAAGRIKNKISTNAGALVAALDDGSVLIQSSATEEINLNSNVVVPAANTITADFRQIGATMANVTSTEWAGGASRSLGNDAALAIQAALTAMRPLRGSVYIPTGQYSIRTAMSLTDVYAMQIFGDGIISTQLYWQGSTPDESMLKLINARENTIRDMWLACSMLPVSVTNPLGLTNIPGIGIEIRRDVGLPKSREATGMKFVRLKVGGTATAIGARQMKKGIAFTCAVGSDGNNSEGTFDNCVFSGCSTAAVSFEHGQSKGHMLINPSFAGSDRGISTNLGPGQTGGSFIVHGGTYGSILRTDGEGAVFDLGAPNDTILISGMIGETIDRFLKGNAASTAAFAITIQGCRIDLSDMNVDLDFIQYNQRGPLTLRGNLIAGAKGRILYTCAGPASCRLEGNEWSVAATDTPSFDPIHKAGAGILTTSEIDQVYNGATGTPYLVPFRVTTRTGASPTNSVAIDPTSGKMLASAGLGVGNSAAATTPGTVTKKMEVFDASGVSLGFVPIYDAIT